MAWTLDEVSEALGEDMQATAGGIIVLDTYVDEADGFQKRRHVKIGTFEGSSFVLTPDGEAYMKRFEDGAASVTERKKATGSKKGKTAPVVAEVKDPMLDDLNDIG